MDLDERRQRRQSNRRLWNSGRCFCHQCSWCALEFRRLDRPQRKFLDLRRRRLGFHRQWLAQRRVELLGLTLNPTDQFRKPHAWTRSEHGALVFLSFLAVSARFAGRTTYLREQRRGGPCFRLASTPTGSGKAWGATHFAFYLHVSRPQKPLTLPPLLFNPQFLLFTAIHLTT